jgi:hypothetical protein
MRISNDKILTAAELRGQHSPQPAPRREEENMLSRRQHREVGLRHVANWEFLGLQTEDHIYGWQSQAVELDHCRSVADLGTGRTVPDPEFTVVTIR